MKAARQPPEAPSRRAACGALLGAVCACTPQSLPKGGRTVPEIELSLALRRTEVISGESLALQAVVSNRGAQSFPVQIGPHSLLSYEFLSADGRLRFAASQREYLRALTAGLQLPPGPEPTTAAIAPGASRTFREDPALYLMHGLPPGAYRLSARMPAGGGEIESGPVALQVAAARIARLSLFYCPYQTAMVCVFDHTEAAGAAWVFHRETEGEQLFSGVAVRRAQAGAGKAVRDVAAGFHTAPRLEGRWIGWLEEGTLHALHVWGQAVVARPSPVEVELAEPRLVEPGFHLADGGGLFLVAGTAAGRARIQAVTFTPQGGRAFAPAALFETLPERVLARWSSVQSRPVELVWADPSEPGTRLFVRPYNLEGKTLAAGAKQVHRAAGRLLALELDPLGAGSEGWAHALLAPTAPSDGPVYVRVPLGGAPARPREFRVPVPPHPASDWAISGLETGGLLVLARMEERIWVASATGREWMPLTAPQGEIRHLRLAASTGEYWGALWADPASGLRCVSDPEYRARE